jgi:A/G-specific adenine glycosylase
MKIKFIRGSLSEWGKLNSRNFIWRKTNDPYHILISEIMLHRTRASQVEPIYQRFIKKYPNFNSICYAGVEKIMKELNSLGLRWRSEELHNLSCQIVKKYDGIIPRNKEKLLQLPGIGPYISSAILNFAFDKPEPMLDTNSVRVIGRFFGLSINDSSRRSLKRL